MSTRKHICVQRGDEPRDNCLLLAGVFVLRFPSTRAGALAMILPQRRRRCSAAPAPRRSLRVRAFPALPSASGLESEIREIRIPVYGPGYVPLHMYVGIN